MQAEMYMQEEQKKEETNWGWGQLLNLARVKLEEGRMRETSQSQGPAGKHLAQGRGVKLPGVRLSFVKC